MLKNNSGYLQVMCQAESPIKSITYKACLAIAGAFGNISGK
jgi:hypothetical protein